MKRRIFALLLALALAAAMLPASALASGGDETETIDLAEFLERVEAAADSNGNINYDGGGVTVKWSPKSYCDGANTGGCLFDGGVSGTIWLRPATRRSGSRSRTRSTRYSPTPST